MNTLLRSGHVRCLIAGIVLVAHVHAAPVPGFEDVKAAHAPSRPVLLDRRGVVLSAPPLDAAPRQAVWVGLRDLSPAMQSALIASEDRRFFAHRGVDWQAFVGALWDNLWRSAEGQRPRGASTLTMQLAGLLDPALQAKGPARTLAQKWDQALAAREIETRWSKQQIIEAYLNLATFRPGLPGVHAASIALFGKHPSGLDMGEGLLLAALLRGPGAAPDKVARRACAVARNIPAAPDCEALRALAATALARRDSNAEMQDDLAPHLARRLLTAQGVAVTTTLDAELQRFARDALRSQLNGPAGRSLDDGAVMVLDNRSGDALAYVGGIANGPTAGGGDGIIAPGQAGALLTPFLYELALGRRLLTAASMLDDSPAALNVSADSDIVQNTSLDFKGPVSLRAALSASLEAPALRTLSLVGADAFHERLRALELEGALRNGKPTNSAWALGTARASLGALTNAYRTLANGGEWRAWRVMPEQAGSAPRRVMRADASFIVADILAERDMRVQLFGAQHSLASRLWVAVRSGVSSDLNGGWCVGFSERYTVGVWAGSRAGVPSREVALAGATAIWREIMNHLHRQRASAPPPIPEGVLARAVSFEPALEAARSELFLAGTQTPRVALTVGSGDAPALPRIVHPGDRMVIALAAHIPEGQQHIHFVSNQAGAGSTWLLNGKAVTDKNGRPGWTPVAGRHVLQLVAADGEVLDSVSFEVRVAPANSE